MMMRMDHEGPSAEVVERKMTRGGEGVATGLGTIDGSSLEKTPASNLCPVSALRGLIFVGPLFR